MVNRNEKEIVNRYKAQGWKALPEKRLWTKKENKKLKEMFIAGKDDQEMARNLKRSREAVMTHRSELGLRRKREPRALQIYEPFR